MSFATDRLPRSFPDGQPAPRPLHRFGFDSRRAVGDVTELPTGIPTGAICQVGVPLGLAAECYPVRLTVTAFVASGTTVDERCIRVPVKLVSVTLNGRRMLPQGGDEGIVVGIPPTVPDIKTVEGSPYREEARWNEAEQDRWEEVFRSVGALKLGDMGPFNAHAALVLYFENLVMSRVHIFGFIEGHAPSLDPPNYGQCGPSY